VYQSGSVVKQGPMAENGVEWRAMVSEEKTPALQLKAGWRMRWALALAVLADLIQMVAFPIFWEGAASGVDDAVDATMCVLLSWLLGWHWEFAPSFVVKLLPVADLAPLWSIAVANVYRKERKAAALAVAKAAQQG
jgi:hypothetical protein